MTQTDQSVIHFLDIPTIRRLYERGALRRVLTTTTPAKYLPMDSLLDRVSLIQGDITKLEIDAIVNAANNALLGGGGVDGAIHRAAGRGLYEECRRLDGCPTGEAKITRGHKLPAKYVIHTVGPIYRVANEYIAQTQLKSCYYNSLKLAETNNIRSIAFPSISTGVYGYPVIEATHVALNETRKFLEYNNTVARVVFTVFTDADWNAYQNLIPLYFPAS